MFSRKNCDWHEKYVPCVHNIHQRGLQSQVWLFLLTDTPKSAQQRHKHRNQLGTNQTIHVSLLHQALSETFWVLWARKGRNCQGQIVFPYLEWRWRSWAGGTVPCARGEQAACQWDSLSLSVQERTREGCLEWQVFTQKGTDGCKHLSC